MSAVKIGVSRQVVIPKKIHEKLGLEPGDYLEVALKDGTVVFTPKTLVDKRIEKRLAEAREEIKTGHGIGPFKSARAAMRALRSKKR